VRDPGVWGSMGASPGPIKVGPAPGESMKITYALYSFGASVLTALGPAKFLAVYVAAGLGSDLIVLALHKDNPSYRCLGASGSVFGIVMAAVILDPQTSIAFIYGDRGRGLTGVLSPQGLTPLLRWLAQWR
jgi:Rhomboid family